MKCFVSGATGFIGRQLCQQLIARGDSVIALSKSGAPLVDGTATLALDLTAHEPAAELLQGVDVVFHLAGIAHRQAPQADYQRLNFQVTLHLARQAAAAGVKCFVFLSSVKAMGVTDSVTVRSEDDCVTPVDDYGRSKWQAECALREEFSGAAMAVVILRPALVYGANVKGNLHRLATAVRRGLPRPPPEGARSMIAVQDLADLLCQIAVRPPVGVHTWIACDGSAYSTRLIYDLLRQAYHKPPGRAWLPRRVWWLAARLLDLMARQSDEPTFKKLFGTELYSNAAVLAATHWQPQCRLDDVISGMLTDAQVSSQ
ncbi:MAG: NAD-dependent epimerase/dehydratase family protein [Halioglobus sp.]